MTDIKNMSQDINQDGEESANQDAPMMEDAQNSATQDQGMGDSAEDMNSKGGETTDEGLDMGYFESSGVLVDDTEDESAWGETAASEAIDQSQSDDELGKS